MMKIYEYEAVVVGSGAAGLSAAARLKEAGVNIALVTEQMNAGTSRNTGSDKQTYYKLSLGGSDQDSVTEMAQNLFSFGAVDGDNALCEAALSSRCFFSLVEGGVPFPHNAFGEYVGYKTDHDPYRRATSAGPLTSKYMTELWEKRVKNLQVPILDDYLAIEILKQGNCVRGLLMLHQKTGQLAAVCAPYVVLATGGPAGVYADSVYPTSQCGALGLAAEAGVVLQNLTEWQYGLASVAPRWNVSGTYMQVLPRFVSVDGDGVAHEFLAETFADPYEALSLVFFKGYQWPFDCKKVQNGSSLLDLLVYREQTVKQRKVYLDFTKNPFGLKELDYSRLSSVAYDYLKKAGALFGRPIDRLLHMNRPAVELYQGKGVDLTCDCLEIALSAQHHNGGIAVDENWMTTLYGLFAVGECAGTHGISRPGGAALNAGQVGALRAAQYIAAHRQAGEDGFAALAEAAEQRQLSFINAVLQNSDNVSFLTATARRRMSDCGAAIRRRGEMEAYYKELQTLLCAVNQTVGVKQPAELYKAYRYRDLLLAQSVLLFAMLDYEAAGLASRGSAILCHQKGVLPQGLDEGFRFLLEGDIAPDRIQTVMMTESGLTAAFRPVRPLVFEEDAFETVWRRYRESCGSL